MDRGLAVAAQSAFAAPNITLDKQAPDRVLFGEDPTVSPIAADPANQPCGYNLSFRDVLPAGGLPNQPVVRKAGDGAAPDGWCAASAPSSAPPRARLAERALVGTPVEVTR